MCSAGPVALVAGLLTGLLAACGPNVAAGVSTRSASTVVVESTVASAPGVTTTVDPGPPLTRTLGPGDSGDEVLALQTRLNELHFDVKVPDGYMGPNTTAAIWAFEQLVLGRSTKDVTGRVTPEMWERLKQPLGIVPRRPLAGANHVEVYLPEQTAVVFEGTNVKLISHISSGSGEHWCATPRNVPDWPGATTTTLPVGKKLRRMCGESITPGGIYQVERKETGWYDIPLGRVYNPIFFNGGIALHGYDEVPLKPASHGCIRFPMHIAEYLPKLVHIGDQVLVWDGVQEPEVYGGQHAPLDQPDPTDTDGI